MHFFNFQAMDSYKVYCYMIHKWLGKYLGFESKRVIYPFIMLFLFFIATKVKLHCTKMLKDLYVHE